MRSQVYWVPVKEEDRDPDLPEHIKQLTGINKSRPGFYIRQALAEQAKKEFVYNT